ncbi:AroM family protein [Bacillaceae bacterium SIJ1]|uniref:AroM family protein n=1 Tax=Litoribacterium kuwaitense TaxID=1398745 RepID=UPI0013EBA82C|nr:AroM family protein [Litoribacterium kuwaitense]NGP45720.1 AroM family protein [Litoribacterium kuwaitense]
MSIKIGVVTIGQAPRTDLIPEVEKFFPHNVEFIQRGVLDHFTHEKLDQIKPEPGQTTLVSRLKDGTDATMAKEKILPIIQQIISEFNQDQVNLIVLACTGEFKPFHSDVPIIYPDYLLNHVAQGIFRNKGQIGIIVPLPEQFKSIEQKWKSAGFKAIPAASSPYAFDEQSLITAANELRNYDINTIVLDCIGYSEQMKVIVKKHSRKNVILSRNIVFKNAAELY